MKPTLIGKEMQTKFIDCTHVSSKAHHTVTQEYQTKEKIAR